MAKNSDELLKDLLYEVVKALRLIWLVKKIPFLDLKDWVKDRELNNG